MKSLTQHSDVSTEIVIGPRSWLGRINLRALHEYRELLYFLIWRDFAVRYKQTILGVSWAIIRPLATAAALYIAFGRVAGLESGGTPYFLLTFSGMLIWQLSASGLQQTSLSVVGSANLVTKVYFPRIILPISAVTTAFVDFAIGFLLYLVIAGLYGVTVTLKILLLPLFVVEALLLVLGLGSFFAALHVRFRDIGHLLPFLLQIGLFISPVGFRSEVVPAGWQFLFELNPLVGIIEGARWAMIGSYPPPSYTALVSSWVAVLVLCIAGLAAFARAERKFADLI